MTDNQPWSSWQTVLVFVCIVAVIAAIGCALGSVGRVYMWLAGAQPADGGWAMDAVVWQVVLGVGIVGCVLVLGTIAADGCGGTPSDDDSKQAGCGCVVSLVLTIAGIVGGLWITWGG